MRFSAAWALLCVAMIAGCEDRSHGPKLALHKGEGSGSGSATVRLDAVVPPPHISQGATTKVPADFHYQGRTVEEWALALNDSDQEAVRAAAEALLISGPPGRPYLFQGLEHGRTETRRLCLENMTVSDMRIY